MKKNYFCKRFYLFSSVLIVLLSACTKNNLYEKNISINSSGWQYGEKKIFDITILDTASVYNFYINIRHTDVYAYNNLWLNITSVLPDSSRSSEKVNVILSEPEGKWIGNCVDGICYSTILVQPGFHFKQAGDYTFEIEQDMRINPLPAILDIGIRLEK